MDSSPRKDSSTPSTKDASRDIADEELKTVVVSKTPSSPSASVTGKPDSSKPDEDISLDKAELTRLSENFRSGDSSTGFAKAKEAADQALENNKVILNKRFVLEKVLGAGGMGTVYRAKDLRKVEANDLNPHVAIKVLNDDFKNHPDAFITLQREASRSHTLSHPNIVTVHDFDRDDNVIFMTMEFLQGRGLEELTRESAGKGLPTAQALSIIDDCCQALSHAHNNHIIHSDLKPANIFVTDKGAKVLDFGIARITSQAAQSGDYDAGDLGALTPAYASLEMINREAPDASDDVYAMAIIAYELLSGSHPYQRKTAAEALAEGLKPARLKQLNKRQWKVLESALSLRRQDRTPSIATFAEQLTGKYKLPIFKIASAVFFVGICALGYYSLVASDDITQVIDDAYSKADSCIADNNYSCAINSMKAVLELSPNQSEAKDRLADYQQRFAQEKLTQQLSLLNTCLNNSEDPQHIACAEQALLRMRNIDSRASVLADTEKKVANARIKYQISQAQICLAEANFQCAIDLSQQVLANSVEHQQAIALHNKAQSALTNQLHTQQQQARQVEDAISKANDCLNHKRYQCALRAANEALALSPNNTLAQTIATKATLKLEELEERTQRAQQILTKGQNCLQRKNYNCAIANAESALALVPNYQPAIHLHNKAKKAVSDLKKRILIQ